MKVCNLFFSLFTYKDRDTFIQARRSGQTNIDSYIFSKATKKEQEDVNMLTANSIVI